MTKSVPSIIWVGSDRVWRTSDSICKVFSRCPKTYAVLQCCLLFLEAHTIFHVLSL